MNFILFTLFIVTISFTRSFVLTQNYLSKSCLRMTSRDNPVSSNDAIKQQLFNTLKQSVAISTVVFGMNTLTNASTKKSIQPVYANIRKDLEALIKEDLNRGPTFVRLSWHSSGTYDKITQSGGSEKGTIRFKEELADGANAGLKASVDLLEPIYQKYKDDGLSYADLFTLVGVVAVKTLGQCLPLRLLHILTTMIVGGPDIGWKAGRVDSFDENDVPPRG